MTIHRPHLIASISLLLLAACAAPPQNNLTNDAELRSSTGETSGGAENTRNHSNDPAGVPNGVPFQPADPAQIRAMGSPELTARLHACGKMTVTSLADLLESRGLTGGGERPNGAVSGRDIFDRSDSAAALGGPNYGSRLPEAPFASTAATSKMFDIFTMAAYDAITIDWTAPACLGVKVLGADGKFTKDGIACLIGKPATDAHVAIANDAITKSPADGAKIAIAALLSAAHTCQ